MRADTQQYTKGRILVGSWYEMRQAEGSVCSQLRILVKAGVQSRSMKGIKRRRETDNRI